MNLTIPREIAIQNSIPSKQPNIRAQWLIPRYYTILPMLSSME